MSDVLAATRIRRPRSSRPCAAMRHARDVSAAAVALSLAGCFAVRFAFYAMHMTSGM